MKSPAKILKDSRWHGRHVRGHFWGFGWITDRCGGDRGIPERVSDRIWDEKSYEHLNLGVVIYWFCDSGQKEASLNISIRTDYCEGVRGIQQILKCQCLLCSHSRTWCWPKSSSFHRDDVDQSLPGTTASLCQSIKKGETEERASRRSCRVAL